MLLGGILSWFRNEQRTQECKHQQNDAGDHGTGVPHRGTMRVGEALLHAIENRIAQAGTQVECAGIQAGQVTGIVFGDSTMPRPFSMMFAVPA